MGLVSRLRTALKDHVLTAPSPFFAPHFRAPDEARVAAAVRSIQETAAYDAGPLIAPQACDAIRAEMDAAFAGRRPDVRSSINPKTGIGHVASPLRLHPAVLEIGTHPLLLAIVERYLRRRFFVSDVDMRRVPPMTMRELDERSGTRAVGYTSSHWHRDVRGRQVKVMVYLTDVGPTDSNFAFVPTTHIGHQARPAALEESRLTEEETAALGIPPVECYGSAGTALIFDTNMVHRLRRKAGASTRDSITFYYTPGQELRPMDVDPAQLARLPEAARALFDGRRA